MTDAPLTASFAPSPDRVVPRGLAARIAIGASIATVLLLASLHALSPEFDPSWRVVSEYANGGHGWVLSAMFACWGLASWCLAVAARPHATGRTGKLGLGLLIVAGLGQTAAAVFDIRHPLHDVTAVLGGLGLPIAAMLLSVRLRRDRECVPYRRALLVTANLTWISQVALIASLVVLVTTYVGAGGDMNADPTTITSLPAGTIAVVGWANRFLVLAYCAWIATAALHLSRRPPPARAASAVHA